MADFLFPEFPVLSTPDSCSFCKYPNGPRYLGMAESRCLLSTAAATDSILQSLYIDDPLHRGLHCLWFLIISSPP